MDDETAVFAEPVAAACRIFEQMTVEARARVKLWATAAWAWSWRRC